MTELAVFFLFRIFNFFLLIGIALFFGKKYILPYIRNTQNENNINKKKLNARRITLEKEETHLTHAIQDQEKECVHLTETIRTWKNKVSERQEQEQKKLAAALDEIKEKVTKQNAYISQMHAQRVIMPQVLEQAHDQLNNLFTSENHGVEYLNKTISYMKDNS